MAKAKKMDVTAPASVEQPRTPLDLGELLMRFHRLLSNKYRRWRFCAEPHCRRERTCMGKNPRLCSSDGRPKPVRTKEEGARIMADLHKDLKRLSAQKQAEEEMAAIAASQPAAPKPSASQPAAAKGHRRDRRRATR